MSPKINILFLGGAKRVSLAERFFSAGNKLGYQISVYAYELNKIVPFATVGQVDLATKKRTHEEVML